MAQHTIQALQSELDSLRADNIKLFEKIKFLQSYPGRVSPPPPPRTCSSSSQRNYGWRVGQDQGALSSNPLGGQHQGDPQRYTPPFPPVSSLLRA